MSLRLCPSCSRHVREDACPFCGADVTPVAPNPAMPRMARIALVSIGAAAVATATACGSTVAAYGGPPDTGADAAQDAGQDAMATFYGGVPIDSGGAGDSGND